MDELLLLCDHSSPGLCQGSSSCILVPGSLLKQAAETTRSQESEAALLRDRQREENAGVHLAADRATGFARPLHWTQSNFPTEMRSDRCRYPQTSLDELLCIRGTEPLATKRSTEAPARKRRSMWSADHRSSPSKRPQ